MFYLHSSCNAPPRALYWTIFKWGAMRGSWLIEHLFGVGLPDTEKEGGGYAQEILQRPHLFADVPEYSCTLFGTGPEFYSMVKILNWQPVLCCIAGQRWGGEISSAATLICTYLWIWFIPRSWNGPWWFINSWVQIICWPSALCCIGRQRGRVLPTISDLPQNIHAHFCGCK